jgi:hypothetical protein
LGVRILHISLSLFLFFSTTGLEINSHFCSGNYKYSSLFVQPENCCAKVQGHYPSKDSCKDEANQTPCCQNKASFFKSNLTQNYTADAFPEVNLPTFKVVINPFLNLSNLNYQRLDIDYYNYKPPLISEDFPILFQVFRC